MLFKQLLSFDIAAQDVVEDCHIIRLGLLLNLEDVNVLREFFNLSSSNGIDQCCLTNTITTDQTILAALHQLQLSIFKESLTTDDQGQVVDQDVGLERIGLVVHHSGGRDALLVQNELLDLLVEGILHPLLILGLLLLTEGVLLLGVVVALRLFGIEEGVQKLLLSVDSRVPLGLDFVDGDGVYQLFGDDGVTVLDLDELLVMEDLDDVLTLLVGFIVSVGHSISHEV